MCKGQVAVGEATGGEQAQVHHRLELSAHQNCDWNLICLMHSVDILISISYNLLGKEAQLAAAWLNGLCTQSNLLHLQFPVLENLSVSLSEVSIAITAILVKHWKWQSIQIVILLDSNCSSLHWPPKCYFLGDTNCNWRKLVLCLSFPISSSPPAPWGTLLAVYSVWTSISREVLLGTWYLSYRKDLTWVMLSTGLREQTLPPNTSCCDLNIIHHCM